MRGATVGSFITRREILLVATFYSSRHFTRRDIFTAAALRQFHQFFETIVRYFQFLEQYCRPRDNLLCRVSNFSHSLPFLDNSPSMYYIL